LGIALNFKGKFNLGAKKGKVLFSFESQDEKLWEELQHSLASKINYFFESRRIIERLQFLF